MSAIDMRVGAFGAGVSLHSVVGISVRGVNAVKVGDDQCFTRVVEFQLDDGRRIPVTAFADRPESLLVITDTDRALAADPRS